MRKLFVSLFCTAIVLIITTTFSQSQKLSNELIWGTETFMSDPKPILVPLTTTNSFAQIITKENATEQLILVKDFETGLITDTLFDTKRLPNGESIDKFTISNNNRFVLISTSEVPECHNRWRF